MVAGRMRAILQGAFTWYVYAAGRAWSQLLNGFKDFSSAFLQYIADPNIDAESKKVELKEMDKKLERICGGAKEPSRRCTPPPHFTLYARRFTQFPSCFPKLGISVLKWSDSAKYSSLRSMTSTNRRKAQGLLPRCV
ncbi:hypothetical protein BV22DRAFT_1035108, partial [Leucogyrophana mollusca]